MIRSLIGKELGEHLPVLVLLFVLAGLGCPLLYGIVRAYDMGSSLDTLRWFLLAFVTLSAVILSQRLVAHEYRSKTQLFLEALPVSRALMVAVKYLFGLVLLMALVAAAFGMLLLIGLPGESLSAKFVTMLAIRASAFSLCIYTSLFASGFLGRYRITIFVVMFIGATYLNSQTQFEIRRFGPFALVDERFAYERDEWPVKPLVVTGAMTAVALLLTAGLALVREGSAAAMLAERMSHREKLFVTILVFFFLFTLSTYDSKARNKPFDLLESVVEQRDGVTVKVSIFATDNEVSRELAQVVASDLFELRQYLKLPRLPPVFIVGRRDLDADLFEWRPLLESEGVLGRANFAAPDFDIQRFLSELVPHLLSVASDGRVEREPNRWVLDGFGPRWGYRDRTESSSRDSSGDSERDASVRTEATGGDSTNSGDAGSTNANTANRRATSPDRVLALRAAYGSAKFRPETDEAEWLRFRERVGDNVANAVAWSGLEALAQSRGEVACQRFLTTALRLDVPHDVRGGLYEWRHPLREILLREATIGADEFWFAWSEHLKRLRREFTDDLSLLSRVDVDVHFETASRGTARVAFDARIEPPPHGDHYTLIFARLKRFDVEVPREDWQREEFDYKMSSRGTLAETFPRGTRLMTALAVQVDELDCEVISGWRRWEVP